MLNTHVLNYKVILNKNIKNSWINCHFGKSSTTKPQLYSAFPNVLRTTIQRVITIFQPFIKMLLHRIKGNSMERTIIFLCCSKKKTEPVPSCQANKQEWTDRNRKESSIHCGRGENLIENSEFTHALRWQFKFLNAPQFFEISRSPTETQSPVTLQKHYVCHQQVSQFFHGYTW